MKTLKKVLGIVLSISMVMVMLTGCVYEKTETTINANGSGTVFATVGFTKEFYESMKQQDAEFAGTDEEDFVEKVIDGKTYYVVEDLIEFNSIEELNEMFAGETSSEVSDSTYTLHIDREADDDFTFTFIVDVPEQGLELETTDEFGTIDSTQMDFESMGMDESTLAMFKDEMVMQLVFKFPTNMSLVSGQKDKVVTIDGKTVTINLLEMPTEEVQHIEYVVKSVKGLASDNVGGLTFSDVPERHWAYSTIMKAVELGLFQGTSTPVNGVGTFAPDKTMTRAEFITVILRELNISPIQGESKQWFDGYVRAAIESGIISDGDFTDYTVGMSREEMSYVMLRAAKFVGVDVEDNGASEKIPDWNSIGSKYQTSVAKAYSAGLLVGVDSKGTFAPNGTVTRGQGATVLVRLYELINK